MAIPATLTAVSLTTTNNNSMNSNKRKSEKNILSSVTRKSTEHRISSPPQPTNEIDNNFTRSIPTFRIPKKARSTASIASQNNNQQSPPQTNESIQSSSSQVSTTKSNLSPNHQSNDDSNSQQGKRKFSLSQYKEHKRIKSNDTTLNCSADVDMRMNTTENLRNSPPTTMDIDSSIISSSQSVVSPKTNDISKDLVLKSNLSEPGVKKLIKKKVIWADEKNRALVQTSVFEIDDSEATDIHAFARQCATNISIAQIEKLLERDLRKRQNFQDINSFDNDDRANLPPLPTLIRILLPDTIHPPVVKSQEYLVQEERERTVLQALLMRSFLPDSPGEPDGDLPGNSTNEPKSIPLEDNVPLSEPNPVSSVNDIDSTSITALPPSPSPPSLSSLSLDKLSPEVAQILAHAKGNATSATVNTQMTPAPSINPTLTSIPNLSAATSLLSALLNITRSNGMETVNVPPPNSMGHFLLNLPPNFNMPPPNGFPINALSLGLLPPSTTSFNNPVFPSPTINSITNSPPVRFASPSGPQSPRFNHNTNNFRGNNRGRIYRRGLYNNNNNNNRRDYYQNRNHNRNVFS